MSLKNAVITTIPLSIAYTIGILYYSGEISLLSFLLLAIITGRIQDKVIDYFIQDSNKNPIK